MSCEHAETTTLLWLYGEAPDAHAEHVAGCEACQAVLHLHSETAAVTGPVLPALRTGEAALPEPANAPMPAWLAPLGGALAMAATVLLLVPARGLQDDPLLDDTPRIAVIDLASPAVRDAALFDEMDLAFDDLDAELDALASDLDTL